MRGNWQRGSWRRRTLAIFLALGIVLLVRYCESGSFFTATADRAGIPTSSAEQRTGCDSMPARGALCADRLRPLGRCESPRAGS